MRTKPMGSRDLGFAGLAVNALGVVIVIALTRFEVAAELRHLVNSDFLYLPALYEDAGQGWAGIQGWQSQDELRQPALLFGALRPW